MKTIVLLLFILFVISLIDDVIYAKKQMKWLEENKKFYDFLMKNTIFKRLKNENDFNFRDRIKKKSKI